uniref:Arsenite methyltransferase n=1 Tax=Craspedostauros australis TaxID=1486917 RepID=A0A7R9WVD5_9STRA
MRFIRACSLLAVIPAATAFVVVEGTASPITSSSSSPASSTSLNIVSDPTNNLIIMEDTHESVTKYYGKELQTSDDLKTNACCTAGAPPKYIRDAIGKIHNEVVSKYYGCGLCLPQYDLEGANMLDLGCGAGRDVYIASQLVGAKGKVVGVDMTDEQLNVARKHQDYHAEKFGFSNVEFKKGYLEKLKDLDLEAESFDVIISNCVINLCTDKEAVLEECLRLLKPGGELYFSDVYANRRVPMHLQKNEVLWGECLSGALYWNDFENMSRKIGFADPRLVEDAPITVQNAEVERCISESGCEKLKFYSATYRLWKLPLEPHCEDYGQAVIYKGTLPRYPSGWLLDKHHFFENGKIHPVCGNTYRMLADTRLKEHFEFIGNWDNHYGIFEGCGSSLPYDTEEASSGKGASTGGCC